MLGYVVNRQQASKTYSENSSRLPSPAADKLVDLARHSLGPDCETINSYTCVFSVMIPSLDTILLSHDLFYSWFFLCFYLNDAHMWQYSNQRGFVKVIGYTQTEVNFFFLIRRDYTVGFCRAGIKSMRTCLQDFPRFPTHTHASLMTSQSIYLVL
jgi:hypothetical protein